MSDTKELRLELHQIICLIDSKADCEDVLDGSMDWLYELALANYGYSESEVEKMLKALRSQGYLNKRYELTDEGCSYLYQNKKDNAADNKKESRKASVEFAIKTCSGIVAVLTAIVTLILLICDALKK